ncbi:hypothetical protein [Agrobacterium vitis]|uniref:hypothetical protein n=1 Tax=Agrobacterium vitis TaxID=373 RepID=UPI0012E7F722|nr:hypothetical protein [Agrobacterium vitis]MUZ64368.1 hypothetical protein [Agrobacterium vitis]
MPIKNYILSTDLGWVETYILNRRLAFAAPIQVPDTQPESNPVGVFWQAVDVGIDAAKSYFDSNFPIRFCVCGAQIVNAVAAHAGDKGLIVIAEGLIKQYISLTFSVMQSVHFEKFLASGEPRSEENLPFLVSRREAIQTIVADPLYLPRAESVDTGLLALLIQVGATFLTAHEAGHILRGHLVGNLYGEALAVEDEISFASEHSVTRTLEFDADFFATETTLYHCVRLADSGMYPGILESREAAVRMTLCSIYLMVSLFEGFSLLPPRDAGSATHPPALVRLLAIYPAISAIVENWVEPVSEDELQEIVKTTSSSVEMTLLEFGKGCMSEEEIDLAIDQGALLYANHVENWRIVRSQLQADKNGNRDLPIYR